MEMLKVHKLGLTKRLVKHSRTTVTPLSSIWSKKRPWNLPEQWLSNWHWKSSFITKICCWHKVDIKCSMKVIDHLYDVFFWLSAQPYFSFLYPVVKLHIYPTHSFTALLLSLFTLHALCRCFCCKENKRSPSSCGPRHRAWNSKMCLLDKTDRGAPVIPTIVLTVSPECLPLEPELKTCCLSVFRPPLLAEKKPFIEGLIHLCGLPWLSLCVPFFHVKRWLKYYE